MNKGRIDVGKYKVSRTNWEINEIISEITEFCSDLFFLRFVLKCLKNAGKCAVITGLCVYKDDFGHENDILQDFFVILLRYEIFFHHTGI